MPDKIRENIFYALKKRSSSYKCFLLLYLLKRINTNKTVFSFGELSKGIVLEAWNYLPYFDGPLTKIDDLFDLCIEIIEKSNYSLTVYSTEKQVNEFLACLQDKSISKRINNLCLIAPYRLDINESIVENLHGVIDRKKNGLIEEYSHQYDLFYRIDNKTITIYPAYATFIIQNRMSVINEAKEFIERWYVDK